MTEEEYETREDQLNENIKEIIAKYNEIQDRRNGIGLSILEKVKIWFVGDKRIDILAQEELALIKKFMLEKFDLIFSAIELNFADVVNGFNEIFDDNTTKNSVDFATKCLNNVLQKFKNAYPEYERYVNKYKVWHICENVGIKATGADFKKKPASSFDLVLNGYRIDNPKYITGLTGDQIELVLDHMPKITIYNNSKQEVIDFSKMLLILDFLDNIYECIGLYKENEAKYDSSIKDLLKNTLRSKLSSFSHLAESIYIWNSYGPYEYLASTDKFLSIGKGFTYNELPSSDKSEVLKKELAEFNDRANGLLENLNHEAYEKFVDDFQSYFSHYGAIKLTDILEVYLSQYPALKCFCTNKNRFRMPPLRNPKGNTVLYNLLSKYKKLVFFDTETTGLDPDENQIIQFSYAVVDGIKDYSINISKEESIYIKTKDFSPVPKEIVNLTNISDITLQQYGVDYSVGKKMVYDVFLNNSDALFIAYNASFDTSFVISLLEDDAKVLNKINFLDIYVSVPYWWKTNSKKLGDVAKYLGVETSKLHNAKNDVQALIGVTKEFEIISEGFSKINLMFYPPVKKGKYFLPNVEYIDHDSNELE